MRLRGPWWSLGVLIRRTMCPTAAIGRGAHGVTALATSGPAEVGPPRHPLVRRSYGQDHVAEVKMSVRYALLRLK